MKVMAVADLHGDMTALSKLTRSMRGREIDYVLLLGDYSRDYKDEAQNKADALEVLDILSGFKVKALPGNCDHRSIVDIFESKGASLNNTVITEPEATIIGLGGSNVTPFNTPFEYSEEQIAQALRNLYDNVDEGSRLIVASHAPPKDTKCDVIQSGLHVGSSALRQFIEEKKPDLVLCSHIHESGGQEDTIGKTRIVNVGRISDGRAFLVEALERVRGEFYLG
jgi:uncharacterized protein